MTISHVADADSIAPGVAALAGELSDSRVRLVIGGSRRDEVALPTHSNVYVGASMGELAAYARGLLAASSPGASGENAH